MLREKLIELLGLDADASDEEIVQSAKWLVNVSKSPGAKVEKAVREKMAAGLSREAAIQVLQDQAVDDGLRAQREEQEAEARKVAKAKADAEAAAKAKATDPKT